ncbi:MAG: NPXTG-anchored protein [Ruminococcus sp.]|nr:NPXTG-anchored protein [Ruminococcus sp.]
MRKNSLKRIFAALSLSAVAVTSVTCIGASAEEETTEASEETTEASEETTEAEDDSTDSSLTLGAQDDGGWVYEDVDGSYVKIDADTIADSPAKNYITVDEVEGAAGEEVTVNVSILGDGDWVATGIHVYYDTENLELVSYGWGDGVKDSLVIGAKTIALGDDGSVFFTTGGTGASGITDFATLTFKVTDDAVAGDYYPVSISYVAGDLCTNIEYSSYDQKVITGFAFLNYTNGGVYIPEEETEATTEATEATTADEEEETTTTTAAAAATTTTTTTAKGTATSSPKTGVAGVGVAAAGLVIAAGAAFVLRKKED